MAKDQTVVFGSPFKFGFFAGLGFFFASTLMTVITILTVGILGFGTLGAIGTLLIHSQNQTQQNTAPQTNSARWKPAMATQTGDR